MNKFVGFFIMLLLWVVLGVIIHYMFKPIFVDMEAARIEVKAQMGKVVVVENDTLTVIDFDTWNNTYTLSNGVKISNTYYKQLDSVKTK